MIENKNELVPENDLQELWELNGRVKALVAYIEKENYVHVEMVLAILGYEKGAE